MGAQDTTMTVKNKDLETFKTATTSTLRAMAGRSDVDVTFAAAEGSARNLGYMGIPAAKIEAILLTHFHSDHIDGLPPFLIGNEDGTESGHMIVQYTAAAIVNDLSSRAMPASVYSIPTSANAEDHVSMGANEARHVLAMVEDLGKVLALELMTAAQAQLMERPVEGRRSVALAGIADTTLANVAAWAAGAPVNVVKA